jgi:hypothetical protein
MMSLLMLLSLVCRFRDWGTDCLLSIAEVVVVVVVASLLLLPWLVMKWRLPVVVLLRVVGMILIGPVCVALVILISAPFHVVVAVDSRKSCNERLKGVNVVIMFITMVMSVWFLSRMLLLFAWSVEVSLFTNE